MSNLPQFEGVAGGRPRMLQVLHSASFALLSFLICAALQAQPGEDQRVFRDEVAVQWVGVAIDIPYTEPLLPLGQEAFELEVDGTTIPIHDFEGPAEDVGLLVLQDLSGSMGLGGKLERSREIVQALSGKLRDGDDVALMSFGDGRYALDRPFLLGRGDAAEFEALARDWKGWGKTAIRDALIHAPSIARSSRSARTAMVLLTDGRDNLSQISPRALEEVLAASAVPLFLFDLSAPTATPPPPADSTAEVWTVSSLRELARATGGTTFRVGRHLSVERAVSSLVERLRRQYWLAFPIASNSERRPREIEVRLIGGRGNQREARRHAVLHHRSHYIGGAPLPPGTL